MLAALLPARNVRRRTLARHVVQFDHRGRATVFLASGLSLYVTHV